jgi:outer membrane protein TolC
MVAVGALIGGGGCSLWDLGPEPDNDVGPGNMEAPRLLTDSNFQAVIPEVAGDHEPGSTMVPGSTPTTLPDATTSTAPATTQAAATEPAATTQAAASFSVQKAILTGLENNTGLKVDRYNVPIARTGEEQALSQFDPTVSFSLQGRREESPPTPGSSGITDSVSADVGVTEFLPTGTTIRAGVSTANRFYSDASSNAGVTFEVNQALLRGAGLDVNLASLRQAELSTKISQFALRNVAQSLVSDIEQAYWDLAFAERQVSIVQNALDVAQKQLDDTSARIRVGTVAASELPNSQATVAARRENLITAWSTLNTSRMRFMQLITPSPQNFWDRPVELTTLPFIPVGDMDSVEKHVEVALRFRPDINQVRLQLQQGDLRIVQTKNGLLPQLDLFFNFGKSGLASNFGESFTDLNGYNYSAILGVRGEWEPLNRSAQSSYRSSVLSRDQQQQTYDNTVQNIQFDIRNQYLQVNTARQQIDASHATRVAQEAAFQVAQGKLNAGNGTSLDVAVAQAALLSSQLTEIQSVTNHLKALVVLYQLEGSLLFRRGLNAPGAEPVTGPAWRH